MFRRFKALADSKKGITDDDLFALVSDEVHQPTQIWEMVDLQVRTFLCAMVPQLAATEPAAQACVASTLMASIAWFKKSLSIR